MAKIQRLIALEEEYWNKLPKGKGSEIIRSMIRDYIHAQEDSVEDIDVEMLQIEINHLNNQIRQMVAKRDTKQTRFKQIMAEIEEKRIQGLEEEKRRIEEAKKCINCGKLLDDQQKSHKLTKGLVCNGCFLAASAKDFEKWG